jgi:hypothetical protein
MKRGVSGCEGMQNENEKRGKGREGRAAKQRREGKAQAAFHFCLSRVLGSCPSLTDSLDSWGHSPCGLFVTLA